jgi:integrase
MSDNKNILLREALNMYLERISVHKKGHLQEKYRIGQYCRHPIADLPIRSITSVHIAQFRDQRLLQINPRTQRPVVSATVRLDLALLSNLFRIGKIEWGICDENPVEFVRKPKLPAGRDRRLTAREERMLIRYCTKNGNAQLMAIIQLALETAMRQGEILSVRWEYVNLKSRIVHLPDTKNGCRRDVPLTMLARDIIAAQGVKTSGPVFTYTSNGLKSSWRFVIKRLGIDDLHFHDLCNPITVLRIAANKHWQCIEQYATFYVLRKGGLQVMNRLGALLLSEDRNRRTSDDFCPIAN